MKVYDYISACVVEVSEVQYDFIQSLIKHGGKESLALEEIKVSREYLEAWKKDPVFWPVVQGHMQVSGQARGLTPEYVKSYLIGTIAGKEKPSREQMQAINTSVRALGMGLQHRAFQGKVTATPEGTTLEFNDGLASENNDK